MSGLITRADGVVVYDVEGVKDVSITKVGEKVSLHSVEILANAFLFLGLEGPEGELEGMWEFLGLEVGMTVNGKLFEHSGQSAVVGEGRISYRGGSSRR